jgi:transposase InsO family protein
MAATDKQVRLLKMAYEKTGNIEIASAKAGLCRQTGSKYLKEDGLPSELIRERHWRTRQDPFEHDWPAVAGMLADAPELEAKALFEWLCERNPDLYSPGQVRTFQRRVREWLALHGPAKEVYFPQVHEPGRRMSTDFTWMDSLGITIAGEPFSHKLCHCVLTYSNWEWATICFSESLLALRRGVQNAVFRLGRVPLEHWTDHSTAATHEPSVEDRAGTRPFNSRYLATMNHLGMKPCTIQVGEAHENGDVESLNGVLKRRIEQHLLLRGSRDFENRNGYEKFLHEVLDQGNRLRRERLDEELAVMRLLRVDRLPEFDQYDPRVSSWSTIRVDRNSYSVPSRLIGEKVKARCYEDRIDVSYHGMAQMSGPRLSGRSGHRVNYRHIIDWLVRKPGAFRNYRYRDDLFPTLNFRVAYDRLREGCSERVADIEYLRILKHAARTMECEVDTVLELLCSEGMLPRWNTVLEFCPQHAVTLPKVTVPPVDLSRYDLLLAGGAA